MPPRSVLQKGPEETQIFSGKSRTPNMLKAQILEYEGVSRTRLSKNFVLRDFLFSTESACMGLSNFPEDPAMVIRAGKALCEKILEPVLEHFGRFAIVFGYQCREAIEHEMSDAQRRANPRSSNPHMWDRKTFGDEIYARVDILPFCVEDHHVSRKDFGHWVMNNLDVDLLMQWKRSNTYCITISPKPRRVWLEWTPKGAGTNGGNSITHMGADYWTRIYPTLPEHERPKFGPSCTGGSMQWRDTASRRDPPAQPR